MAELIEDQIHQALIREDPRSSHRKDVETPQNRGSEGWPLVMTEETTQFSPR